MDYSKIVQAVLETLIIVVLPVLIRAALVYLADQQRKLQAEAQGAEWDTARRIVADLVRSAEQLGITGELQKYAGSKLDYVLDQACSELGRRGIALDMPKLRALIESQVYQAFKYDKPADKPAELPAVLFGKG